MVVGVGTHGFAVPCEILSRILPATYIYCGANIVARGYTPSTGLAKAPWSWNITCTSTAVGTATLTSVFTLPTAHETMSNWPITPAAHDIHATVVVTSPTIIAEGVPIMWESTDTDVQSWFDSRKALSSSLDATSEVHDSTTQKIPQTTLAPSTGSSQADKAIYLTKSGLIWMGIGAYLVAIISAILH